MTKNVYNFVKSLKLSGKCLDVGSYDVNGSVRDLFTDYTGLDMRAGPNVDIVSKSEYMPFGPVTFDVVTCLEMLEHDATPETTISEISRVLKPGGTVVITLPGIGFPKHEYPCDYWRVTTEGLTLWMWRFREVVVTEDKTHVYGTGRKA